MSLKDIVITKPDFETYRMIIYGVGGIGKSTLASKAEKPIFLDIEGGLSCIDVPSIPLMNVNPPEAYEKFIETLKMLYEEEHDYQTLVVDSLIGSSGSSMPIHAKPKRSMTLQSWDFGRGYVAALGFMEQIINKLEKLRSHKKMNMIMLSHAAQVKVDNPGEEERMKWNLQLHHKSTAKFFQWSDLCLFANYEVRTTKESGSFGKQRIIAHGSERFLFTRDHANHAAKNRLGLPDPIEMDWDLIQEFINNAKKEREMKWDFTTLVKPLIRNTETFQKESIQLY